LKFNVLDNGGREMKKLIVLLIVLTMVNVVSAGVIDILITSKNGDSITPTKEITLDPTDTIDFQITFNAPATERLFAIDSYINVSGNGTLDYSHFLYATYDEGSETWTNVDIHGSFDPLFHVLNTVSDPDYIVEAAKTWGVLGTGAEIWVVKDLYLHCDGNGDVKIWLTNHMTGSVVINATTHALVPWNYGLGVTIHQPPIPEPMTLMLLGLGSLFLARRKK
jgi:hypothetical protein